jgi:hypothetical protein
VVEFRIIFQGTDADGGADSGPGARSSSKPSKTKSKRLKRGISFRVEKMESIAEIEAASDIRAARKSALSLMNMQLAGAPRRSSKRDTRQFGGGFGRGGGGNRKDLDSTYYYAILQMDPWHLMTHERVILLFCKWTHLMAHERVNYFQIKEVYHLILRKI